MKKQDIFYSFLESHKLKTLAASSSSSKTKELPINTTPVKEMNINISTTPKSYNFMNLANNLLETTPENMIKKTINLNNKQNSSVHEESIKTNNNQNIRTFLKTPNQQPIYGIFPINVINQLIEEKDWQTRSNAIEEIDKIIEEIDSKASEFLPHLTDFLKMLIKLIQDNNFKICLTTVNILSKLLVFKELRSKQNIELLYPKLLEKLGDSKIAIRQACIKIIKELFETSQIQNQTFWLESLLNGLESKNQHIREENLNLISFFINKTSLEEPYYEKLLILVVNFLEDLKLKVKMAALETVIVIEKHMKRDKFENILKKMLTIEGFEMIISKLPDKISTSNISNYNKTPENSKNVKNTSDF